MTIKFKSISILSLFLILISCQEPEKNKSSNENDGWKKVGQVEKTIKNINFTFPDSVDSPLRTRKSWSKKALMH